jgi:hypothetical protein
MDRSVESYFLDLEEVTAPHGLTETCFLASVRLCLILSLFSVV